MSSYRRTIREALQARLLAAATVAGANVFTGRARPILEILRKREAVISVYTSDESSDRSQDGNLYTRALSISVELAMGGGDDLDDQLDLAAEQIEAAINADPTLGTLLASDMVLNGTQSEIASMANQMVGAVRMDYEATYYTEAYRQEPSVVWPVPDDFDPAEVCPEMVPVPGPEYLTDEFADPFDGDQPGPVAPRPDERIYGDMPDRECHEGDA